MDAPPVYPPEYYSRKPTQLSTLANSIFQLEYNLRLYLDNEIENSFRYAFVMYAPSPPLNYFSQLLFHLSVYSLL